MANIREGAWVGRRSEPLSHTVKALGVVSLLTDVSSEITVRTLPLFLANVLGVGTAIIGLIEVSLKAPRRCSSSFQVFPTALDEGKR